MLDDGTSIENHHGHTFSGLYVLTFAILVFFLKYLFKEIIALSTLINHQTKQIQREKIVRQRTINKFD